MHPMCGYQPVVCGVFVWGVCQIEVWDHDFITKDDLIGTTVVDLEDRWFDGRWKEMGGDALEQDQRLRELKQSQVTAESQEAPDESDSKKPVRQLCAASELMQDLVALAHPRSPPPNLAPGPASASLRA